VFVLKSFFTGLFVFFCLSCFLSYIYDEQRDWHGENEMKRSLNPVDYSSGEEALAVLSKALSHPVRIRILQLLQCEACCFTGELTTLIPMAQSTISQHLKALLESGLIQGEINPPKVRYCINRESWRKAQLLFGDFFGEESGVGRGQC